MVPHGEVEQFIAMEAESRVGQRVDAEAEQEQGKEEWPCNRRAGRRR
jgi:hypothetical protein